ATAAVATAVTTLTRSAWTGVRVACKAAAQARGSAGTTQARVPTSSVTQPPQQLGVAGPQLEMDALRERRRDGDHESEVEQRAELDDVGQPAGDRDGEQGDAVLGHDQPEQLHERRAARDGDRDA